MLVLSRKVGETLCIGDNVTVTVVRIGPGTVRIGIHASPDAVIARDELLPGVSEEFGQRKPANGSREEGDANEA